MSFLFFSIISYFFFFFFFVQVSSLFFAASILRTIHDLPRQPQHPCSAGRARRWPRLPHTPWWSHTDGCTASGFNTPGTSASTVVADGLVAPPCRPCSVMDCSCPGGYALSRRPGDRAHAHALRGVGGGGGGCKSNFRTWWCNGAGEAEKKKLLFSTSSHHNSMSQVSAGFKELHLWRCFVNDLFGTK